MLDPTALATAAVAFFVAAAAPGPATVATAATAMAQGRAAALAFGAGLSLGLAMWGLAAALGLGALLIHSSVAMTVLRLLGGAYLLYLAFRAARSALSSAPITPPAEARLARPWMLARRGFLLNASNPKAVLAWVAVLALGLPAGTGAAQLWAAFAVCAVLGALVYAGYALAFSLAPLRAGYARARRGVEAATALVFGAAGARLIAGRTADAP